MESMGKVTRAIHEHGAIIMCEECGEGFFKEFENDISLEETFDLLEDFHQLHHNRGNN